MAKYGSFKYGTAQKYGTSSGSSVPGTMKPATLSVPTMKPTGA